jgi:hypothetical protein
MMRVILLLSLIIGSAHAMDLKSEGASPSLVELYTSESCSSCPPAEKWLNSLKTSGTLWKDYVPVEFHVDYWNHLHWKDKYSSPEFSTRQREYHRKIRGGVYTPQVIANGRNVRNWRGKSLRKQPTRKLSNGSLTSKVDFKSGKVNIQFAPGKKTKVGGNHYCNFALMSGGIETKVRSGENEGRSLKHEFVVRNFKKNGLSKKGSNYQCEIRIPNNVLSNLESPSVAVWVSNESTGEVLAATGNWVK